MLTKLKLSLVLATPLVAGVATYAAAQGDHAPADVIKKFDTNGDGTLDDAERAQKKAAWKARRAERHQEALARYDANKDGTLDAAERQVKRDDRLAARFQKLDANGDGQLTIDEFKAGADQGFHGRRGHRSHRGMKP
jgi:Ca2+-binding EF-hand superfamily protein